MREYISIHSHRYPGVTLQPLSELRAWAVANIILFTTEEYVAQLKMNPHIQVKQFSDSMTYIDITAPGITKGSAAVHWSERTGIPLHQTMVFGDSDNDLEIFQVAGWSVALGNAIEPLKAIADRIIAHTDQDGLAIYLENIVKGEAL
jgi:hydroxymethylpyrimidine pyrophosphatase-like HAD family hydrolase